MLKSRKKILLSSIAMLLVALVALGSATFAWYMSNSTVTASTTTFKAAVDTGLVIRHANGETWRSAITDLNQVDAAGLTPASITYANTLSGTRGGTGTSNARNISTMSGTPTVKTIENGSYFLVDSFFVASDSGSAQNAVFKVLGGSSATGQYLNIAIYVNGTLEKVFTNDSAFNASTGFGKFANASSGDGVVIDSNNFATSGKVAKFGATGEETVGTFNCPVKADTDNTGCRVDIVAFADGFNSNCTSDTVNQTPLSLTYSFSAVA